LLEVPGVALPEHETPQHAILIITIIPGESFASPKIIEASKIDNLQKMAVAERREAEPMT